MTAAARRGTTTVSERAVRRIAERAATEALPGRDRVRTTGAATSVRGGTAEVSLGVTLPYPAPLADTVRDVQRHVARRTGRLTGLHVPVARIHVTSLAVPSASALPLPAQDAAPPSAGRRTPRRRWSQRRVPVALLAWAAAVACGALALDLIRVHLARLPAGGWRTAAVHWLSGHGPGDPAVVAGGGLTALAGVWMVVLALTPGHPHQCTVHTRTPRLDATVDRSAVAGLVRDAVAGVEGITAVRVRVRGRRARVRARVAFGGRETAHAAVSAAAHDTLTACRLRRGLRLSVVLDPGPGGRDARAGGGDKGSTAVRATADPVPVSGLATEGGR
ncbi:DUF6286 domain-containing Asp23/Gls24 family envelope stress response protein [Streptomyces sp. NPDC101225]|uniref:DUF6286 domain-containing Asp23/Gls24 family envelope stress response protein n=1 Tax=Streptomyces sp. NPDC101225 TaxID=3366135 RepID=UPI00381469B8